MKKKWKEMYQALLEESNAVYEERIQLLEDKKLLATKYIELVKSNNYLLSQHLELTELYVAMANYVTYVQGNGEEFVMGKKEEEKDG